MSETIRDTVILASSSRARARLLKKAGVVYQTVPSLVDEEELKHSMRAAGANASETAISLAELKATKIAREHPQHFVIGGDQILECETLWFDKPMDRDHARAHLLSLRGKSHQLHNAVCVAKAGSVIWHFSDIARLDMRKFSDEFLDMYLQSIGEDVFQSVGGYHLEGMGAQLFNRVDGDFFSILGLPLLPLLDFLRGHKVVMP